MILHLGVLQLPYTDHSKSMTTGDVATILEEKYHIMQVFFDLHAKDIAKELESGIAGAIENAMAGRKSKNLFAGAMSKTELLFRDYLDKEEIKGHADGVPTQAALMGITSRKQGRGLTMRKVSGKGRKYGIPRASFIDSGILRMSFRVWID